MSFKKQHLIFMPENEGNNLELTTELKVQDKHSMASCKICQSRMKDPFVNVCSYETHKSLVKNQTDTLKVWNHTLDAIWKGNSSIKTPTDVISLDDFESDIEEVNPSVVLPMLSTLTNVTTKECQSSNHLNSPIVSKEVSSKPNPTPNMPKSPKSPSQNSQVAEQNLLSLFEEINNVKELSCNVRNAMIYSYQTKSEDEVFFIKPGMNLGMKSRRQELTRMKTKISELQKANVDCEEQCSALQNMNKLLKLREKSFVEKYIRKVHVKEYHGIGKPLSKDIRDSINNDNIDFQNLSFEGKKAMGQVQCIRKQFHAARIVDSKFKPLIQNEMFYLERCFWEKYMKSGDGQNQSVPTKESNLSSKYQKQNTKEKLKEKKRRKRVRRREHFWKQIDNSRAGTPQEIVDTSTTDNVYIFKSNKTPTIDSNYSNMHTPNNNNNTFTLQTPIITSGNTKRHVSTPSKCNQVTPSSQTTPTGCPKHPRFRPYQRLLDLS